MNLTYNGNQGVHHWKTTIKNNLLRQKNESQLKTSTVTVREVVAVLYRHKKGEWKNKMKKEL